MTPEELTEMIRKVLNTHQIRSNKIDSLDKCTGCPWIGWHHDQHVAETILVTLSVEAINAVVEKMK